MKIKENLDLLDLNNIKLGRGVETMYRTTYRTHVNLSSIADNKANILLSINALIISIALPQLLPNFDAKPALILPTFILLITNLITIVLATLSTIPKITRGKVSKDDINNLRGNLLFFGNYHEMEIEDYQYGVMKMIENPEYLYSSMSRDLYYLGVVLAKKYHYLTYAYNIFMFGIIISVIIFGYVFIV